MPVKKKTTPKPAPVAKPKATLKPKAKSKRAAHKPASKNVSSAAVTEAPVTTSIGQDALTGQWAVDVTITHSDMTIVRVNGRAVWLGTP